MVPVYFVVALMGEQREMEADIVADGQQSDMDAPETQVAEAPKTEIGTKTEIETEIANLTDTDSTVTSRTEEIAGIDSSEPTELSEISMPIGLDLNDTNPQDLDIAIISVVKSDDENHATCGTASEASTAWDTRHGWPCLSIALSIVNSLCIQATNATFFALPRANNC